MDPQLASRIASSYFRSPRPLKPLGWGIGGFVYLSPDTVSAVKVYRAAEGFTTELECYRRLGRLAITDLHGLHVPKLLGFDSNARLVHMDFVKPPFLLDFAGVSFDPPDFEADVMEDWHARIRGWHGPNA